MDNKDFLDLREVYLKNMNILYTLRQQLSHLEEVTLEQSNILKKNCCHPKDDIEYIPTHEPCGPTYYYKCKQCKNYIQKYEIDE